MNTKAEMCDYGVSLAKRFCELNDIAMPSIERLEPSSPYYHLRSCAFYRPTSIRIMVGKCAGKGFGGPAWSWPGYAIDRTPYGVIQHELGHHVDHVRSTMPLKAKEDLFSFRIWTASQEEPLTGYLGTDKASQTFYNEWFAENFRLFVTNPDLSLALRPKFFDAMLAAGFKTLTNASWMTVLALHLSAPSRITDQARKKIEGVMKKEGSLL